MSDLIIVSNRGPFSFNQSFLDHAESCLREGKKPDPPTFGEGGLVKAMSGLLRPGSWNTTWIGASMGDRDIDVARGHYTPLFRDMIESGYAIDHFPEIVIDPDNRMHFRYRDFDFYMRFVFFDTRHMHSYYNKFANGFLWPLMHLTRSPLFYKKTRTFPRPEFETNDFVQYTSSGVTFANTIIDELRKSREFWKKDNDIVVWNQDYHLMRIAEVCKALLREEGFSEEERQRIRIGQFFHTPFFNIHEIQGLIREDKRSKVKSKIYDPFLESIESVLQKLTWGMLSNDFIGFHTKEYCDNYLEALEEWFPVDIRIVESFYEISIQGRIATVGAFPIGLDVDRILSEVTKDKTLDYTFEGGDLHERISRDRAAGRIIVGGLERCDYTKGLLERIGIFRHVLSGLRTSGRNARFYQVTSPSRSEIPEYQALYTTLTRDISEFNSKDEDEPIISIDQGIPPPENYRFMKEVDVMFVTPLEDGMNLVAFEYILANKHKNPSERGILLLSTSGASRVLKQKGFSEKDGVVFVNPMKPREASERALSALRSGLHLSDNLISYVEKQRRVEDWAKENIEAILNCRKAR